MIIKVIEIAARKSKERNKKSPDFESGLIEENQKEEIEEKLKIEVENKRREENLTGNPEINTRATPD